MSEPNAPNPNELEQARLLEEAKASRIAAETQLLNKQSELDAAKQRSRTQHEDRLLAEAIRTGPRFHPDRNMLIKLLRDPENGLEFDGDNATALAGDKRVKISEWLDFLAESKPFLADGRSVRAIQQRRAAEEKPTRARSEFTLAEKVAFLKEPNGLAKWEALPAHPVKLVPLDQLDLETFSRLPISMKTKLIAEHGPDFIEELARRKR
jgi:hypothetical protein